MQFLPGHCISGHVVSIDGIRAAKVVFVGKISHANFQRRFLWRGLILAFQRVFQSDLARGQW